MCHIARRGALRLTPFRECAARKCAHITPMRAPRRPEMPSIYPTWSTTPPRKPLHVPHMEHRAGQKCSPCTPHGTPRETEMPSMYPTWSTVQGGKVLARGGRRGFQAEKCSTGGWATRFPSGKVHEVRTWSRFPSVKIHEVRTWSRFPSGKVHEVGTATRFPGGKVLA